MSDPHAAEETPERRQPVPWSVAEGLFAYVLALGLGLLAGPVIFALVLALGFDSEVAQAVLIPLSPVLMGTAALLVVVIRHPGSLGRLWGRRRWRARDLAFGAGAAVFGFVAFNIMLGALLRALVDLAGGEVPVTQEGLRQAATDPTTVWLLAVGTVLLAPVAEELLFRGILFQALRDRLGVAAGIWLSAAAFALVHASVGSPLGGNLMLVAVILPLGALFAWVFHRTGSLAAPIAAHAVFNLVNVSMLAAGML